MSLERIRSGKTAQDVKGLADKYRNHSLIPGILVVERNDELLQVAI